MKMKKLLAMVLCVAMVLSTMGTIVFADDANVIVLDGGTYNWESRFEGKTVKAADGATVIFDMTVNGTPGLNGADVTFEGVTFEWGNTGYKGLQHSGNLTYNNCVINGQPFLYGKSETFNNCTFVQTDVNSYNVWTYSAKEVKFSNCTFESAGRSVLVYHEGKGNKVEVVNSTFYASAPADGKAAIEIGASSMTGDTIVTIDEDTTAEGFANGSVSGNSLWNVKNDPAKTNSSAVVSVAEETVYAKVVDSTGTVGNIVASVNGKFYASLQDAFAAADDGDVIEVLGDVDMGTTALVVALGKNIVLDLNGKTISGTVGTSTWTNSGVVTNNGTLTIKDSVGNGKIEAVGGNNNAAFWNEVGATATLESGSIISTREGSVWNQSYYTLVNHGTMTINGGTVSTNYEGSALVENGWQDETQNTTKANSVMTINGGSFSGGNYNVKVDGYGVLTVNGGNFDIDRNTNILNWNQTTINGGTFTSTKLNVWTGNGTAKSDEHNNAYVAKLNVTDGVFYAGITPFAWANNNHHVSNVTGGIYDKAPSSDFLASDFQASRTATGYEVVKTEKLADTISVIFVEDEAKKTEESKVYNIVLKANGDDKINELASADLTFAYTTDPVTGAAIDFEVAPADKFSMSRYENTNRYMFNYNGVDAYEDTASEITIGTIKVTGYGKFTIATTAGVVNATTVNDNLVDTYTVEGATDNDDTTGALDITGKVDGNDAAIEVPVRTLKVNVAFPNAVIDNVAAYQAMKVEITGNIDGVNKTVKYELGTDTYKMVDGSYVIENNKLVLNNAYTVTVSGAGYRTTRYTVTMTDSKELKFWNNVMDEEQVVEIGKDTSAVKVTYLAGDIVKDNKINIYDLSAVVSYFGSASTIANGYAKYDLNRDGVIDSKDVAYVLVSWGN